MSPFQSLLYAIRGHGVPVGPQEWLAYLRAIREGLAWDLESLHQLGRAVLCRTEADYDPYDVAFASVFEGLELDPEIAARFDEWLRKQAEKKDGPLVDPDMAFDEMWREFLKRLEEQQEEHHGGNRWIGTGGTSPFGHSGRASKGVRVGGKGGNRSAWRVIGDRKWAAYRSDRALDVRNMTLALKALRRLQREGPVSLDIDETIQETARNAGEIELVERPEKKNRVKVVLFMDTGGSMDPHSAKVEELFTAAEAVGTFKSLDAWFFHNAPGPYLWREDWGEGRVPTADVLAELGPEHRLIFVGDASMAPWELFQAFGYGNASKLSSEARLRAFRKRCPNAIWLNPDPKRWWEHPTVSAIGDIFPMFEMTLEGVRSAVDVLRRGGL